MPIKFQYRRNTLSFWTSANPVPFLGEPIITTDTRQIRIGDGVTAFNSLTNKGGTGGSSTLIYQSYGDGSDGPFTASSGTTTLTRDMYYSTFAPTGTAQVVTNGFKIFALVWDMTSAGVGAVNNNGTVGNAASGSTPAAAQTALVNGSVGMGTVGATGTAGTTGAGATGGTGNATNPGNGGSSGASGAGGTGTAGAGGAGKALAAATQYDFRRFEYDLIKGVTLMLGGAGAPSGASGSGDATNSGGAGGNGGNGAGIVVIYAKTIIRGPSTPAGVIQALGGMGGAGGTVAAGVSGGGGGGAGGGGGWVYLCYEQLAGPTVVGAIQVDGGAGGDGGDGFGSGATGGNGGNGGSAGRVTLIKTTSELGTDYIGAAPYFNGSPSVLTAHGAGGPAGMLHINL